MTDEVWKVEVDGINRQILLSHCHVVRIDRGVLLHTAGVVEYLQTIVTEIVQTTIVEIEIAEDVAIIDAIGQDEDKTLRLMTMIRTMAVMNRVMIVRQTIMN